ncbi:hypothetical protein EV644_104128 [Kribbella orskensis]|uniref:Uncharacterized protein n=1 Tax=Kribbella orskensis TaxID=2512216 RepID=A0ABY2BMH0_9ACTN|nr:hypothetical protein EV642_103128 [Kribbella sp. VKM Ac-2500]TCO25624.1 hypothetical protein EV644_104128 [Kribbella orskensis]
MRPSIADGRIKQSLEAAKNLRLAAERRNPLTARIRLTFGTLHSRWGRGGMGEL